MKLITNPDTTKIVVYKIARIIYAETYAKTLRSVEAMASMIHNHMCATGRNLSDLISDSEMFESLNESSSHHWALSVDAKKSRLSNVFAYSESYVTQFNS